MLSILGKADRRQRLCHGLTRRDLLRIGGMALPQLLQLEAEAGVDRSPKALIMIYMCGGPPHQDMYDIQVEARDEIRGPFQPTDTNVGGASTFSVFPRVANRDEIQWKM